MCSIIDGYHFSLLNPNAIVFVPCSMFQPLTQNDNRLLDKLDVATQLTLAAIWNELVYETVVTQSKEDEIADEIESIRASH